MKKHIYKVFTNCLIILFCLTLSITGFSQTKVSALFNNHMVLQQNSNVAIWGTDKPNSKILVNANWGEKGSTKTDKNGNWKLFIKTSNAGGPYKISIKGTEKINLQDVLLGEVWLCSGQSNMEMPLKGFAGQPINNSNETILNSKNTQLRLFNVKRNFNENPLDSCIGTWHQSSPEITTNFSAVAYLYGQMLQKHLNVPIGIICSSVGGTRVEAWTNTKTLDEVGFDFKLDKDKNVQLNVNSPSALFNAMINPIIPYTIKGVVWYQGESNRNNAFEYKKRFSAMIDSWRKEWNIGDFPFYFTQIAPFEYNPDFNSAYLREAQLQTMQNVTNTGMAVTLDIGEKDCIHPAEKSLVAQRLAYWALAKTYNFKEIQYSGPIYKSMTVVNNTIQIEFEHALNGIFNADKDANNFIIAGNDKIFHPAVIKLERGKLIVYSEKVANPVAVRYGWNNYLKGSLYNLFQLPASSFRTDNW